MPCASVVALVKMTWNVYDVFSIRQLLRKCWLTIDDSQTKAKAIADVFDLRMILALKNNIL